MPPNGLELSRSAEAGGATHTLAPAADQNRPYADSADWASQPYNSPRRRATRDSLSARPPSRLQRVVSPLLARDPTTSYSPAAIAASRYAATNSRVIPAITPSTSALDSLTSRKFFNLVGLNCVQLLNW